MSERKPPRILAIAGSDSSGGAGIQADIKTVTMLGGYAMSAITAVTAQNTLGVQAVETLPARFVSEQVASCLDDVGADAVKIGMLGGEDIARGVLEALDGFEGPVVFDPVMVATSGSALADEATIAIFGELMARATLVTPNLPELEALLGRSIPDRDALSQAAHDLSEKFGTAVLAKGGHLDGDRVTDILVDPAGRTASFEDAKIVSKHTHGTGCTLSSAIATLLGHGQSMEHAVRLARQFVRRAIEGAPGFGGGHGPLGHQSVRSLD